MGNTYAPLDEAAQPSQPKKVAYFYDSDVGNYAYTAGHPMKPHRIRVAHSLIMNYGCFKKMEIYRAKPANKFEMTQFHTDEYVDFLQKVTPDSIETYTKEQSKYNVGDDCPVFDGLFEFCSISAGGSMEGAARLNRGKCDIAINWAGGLHHAKKSEASGFCYINGIIELLRFHQRVLYIDIDVHHGDGVEEAFYTTDRVMTVSFHKYGEFFPGTGELRDIGINLGKYYSVNFPLRDGITDEAYKAIFEPVIQAIMDHYQPGAVVLQCGGDSLSGDRLGCFNLSMRGHANCVNFVKSFGKPTLILGGGGYTMRNVARTWAFETGQVLGMEMPATLPYTEYYDYFAPDYELDVRPSNMDNLNTPDYLVKVSRSVIENIKHSTPPSVQMQDVPRESLLNGMDSDAEDEAADLDADQNPDTRSTQLREDKAITRDDEFDDSDEELENGGRVARRPREKSRITDFVNPYADPGPEDDFVMTGANGKPDEDLTMKDDGNAPADDDDAASVDSARPARASLNRPQLWSNSAPAAATEGDDDAGDEMDVDDEDDADEDKVKPAAVEDDPVEADDEDEGALVDPMPGQPVMTRAPATAIEQTTSTTGAADKAAVENDVEMAEESEAAKAAADATTASTAQADEPSSVSKASVT